MRRRILFYCIAGKKHGMGHVKRCLNIATEIRRHNDFDIEFVVIDETEVSNVKGIIGPNFSAHMIRNDPAKAFDIIKNNHPDVIVVDRLSYDMTGLRSIGARIVALDNYCRGAHRYINIIKDDSFEPFAPEENGYQYWAVKRPEKRKVSLGSLSRILISFGYSDPNGFTEKVLSSLNQCRSVVPSAEIRCVITSLFPEGMEEKLKRINKGVFIKKDLESIAPEICWADLCFCGGGNTMIEMIIRGVPCIVIAACPKNYLLASILKKDGYIIDVFHSVNQEKISDLFREIRMETLIAVHQKCQGFEGLGLVRIKELLWEELHYGR